MIPGVMLPVFRIDLIGLSAVSMFSSASGSRVNRHLLPVRFRYDCYDRSLPYDCEISPKFADRHVRYTKYIPSGRADGSSDNCSDLGE